MSKRRSSDASNTSNKTQKTDEDSSPGQTFDLSDPRWSHNSAADQYTYLVISPSPKAGSYALVKNNDNDPGTITHWLKFGDNGQKGARMSNYVGSNPGCWQVKITIKNCPPMKVGKELQKKILKEKRDESNGQNFDVVAGTTEWHRVTNHVICLKAIHDTVMAQDVNELEYNSFQQALGDLWPRFYSDTQAAANTSTTTTTTTTSSNNNGGFNNSNASFNNNSSNQGSE